MSSSLADLTGCRRADSSLSAPRRRADSTLSAPLGPNARPPSGLGQRDPELRRSRYGEAGFLASTAQLDIVTLCILVFVSAVVGDSVGYEVGRRFGPRLVSASVFSRHQGRLDRARGVLRDRGGPAVLLGRFTAFFRAVMPGLAGLSEMRYPSFLMWNAIGGFHGVSASACSASLPERRTNALLAMSAEALPS